MKDIKNIHSVNIGDNFTAMRPIHGETIHKCIRIKKGSVNGSDLHYDGWLVDEDNIMINPKYVTSVIKSK